jgi:hypothetical protein
LQYATRCSENKLFGNHINKLKMMLRRDGRVLQYATAFEN